MNDIPLAIPNLCGNELLYLKECIETNFVSSVGPFVSRLEDEFAKYLGVKRAVAVVNGTAALHLSLILCDVTRDDEVLVPNLTFIAPVNAVKYIGAQPILVDSNRETLGMCPIKLEMFLEENTILKDGKCINKATGKVIKAVIPMHTLGVATDIERIVEISNKFYIDVIEDASEALGAKKNEKYIGSFGKIGCFSFNGNKIITSGGGGMLVTNDDKIADKAKHLSTTAKTDPIHFVHDEVGYNYRMVNILAAIGLAQLENLDKFLEIKKRNALLYKEFFDDIPSLNFHLPPQENESNYWFYSVQIKDNKYSLNHLLENLINKRVHVRPIWELMENIKMYKDCMKTNTDISKDLRNTTINIPCSTNLTDDEIHRVCTAFKEVL